MLLHIDDLKKEKLLMKSLINSSNSRVDRFQKTLMEYGFTVIVRKTRGDDIDAACGQLAGDVIDRTKRTAMKRKFGEGIDVKAVN